jgi:hypothetical protein
MYVLIIKDDNIVKEIEETVNNIANNITHLDIVVNSLEEAVEEVNKLKTEDYNLFRGQSGLWPVVSNLNRLNGSERDEAIKKAFVVQHFLNQNSMLSQDETIAALQHYGIPTNFVDFTTDPNVAAYFTTSLSGKEPNEYGCIICIDKEEVKKIINILSNDDTYVGSETFNLIKTNEVPEAEVIDIYVDNLFRKEAQKGEFLFLPFIGFEIRMPYKRVIFKNSAENQKKFNKLDFFPEKKSELEENVDTLIKLFNNFVVV